MLLTPLVWCCLIWITVCSNKLWELLVSFHLHRKTTPPRFCSLFLLYPALNILSFFKTTLYCPAHTWFSSHPPTHRIIPGPGITALHHLVSTTLSNSNSILQPTVSSLFFVIFFRAFASCCSLPGMLLFFASFLYHPRSISKSIISKVLLYSTRNYIQYPVINHNRVWKRIYI